MKHLIKNGLPTKKIDFMGTKGALTISKLSNRQIREFQAFTKEHTNEDGTFKEDSAFLAVQYFLIRTAVAEAADMSDEDFEDFALDDLAKLTEQILEFSGVNVKAKN